MAYSSSPHHINLCMWPICYTRTWGNQTLGLALNFNSKITVRSLGKYETFIRIASISDRLSSWVVLWQNCWKTIRTADDYLWLIFHRDLLERGFISCGRGGKRRPNTAFVIVQTEEDGVRLFHNGEEEGIYAEDHVTFYLQGLIHAVGRLGPVTLVQNYAPCDRVTPSIHEFLSICKKKIGDLCIKYVSLQTSAAFPVPV